MMEKTTSDNKNWNFISAVDEFDYSTQQEEYNKYFIAWRRNKDNQYAHNFYVNKKESVYVDGQGFINESAAKAENSVLNRILFVVGAAMLCLLLIDDILSKVVILTLSALGVNIHVSLASSVIYGGKTEIIIFLTIFNVLKYLLPIAFLHGKFKMPPQIARPNSLKDKNELVGTIAAAMIVSSIAGFSSSFLKLNGNIYNFFRSYEADMSVLGQKEFIIYVVFDVIIMSFLSELLFRGEMFTALRQFGDVYAVLVTSLISGIATHDFRLMLINTLIAAVSAIGTLRSGTIIAAVSAKISYKIYLLILTGITSGCIKHMNTWRYVYLSAVLLSGFVIMFIVFADKERRESVIFAGYRAYVPLRKKLLTAVKCIPLASFIALCLFVSILKITF